MASLAPLKKSLHFALSRQPALYRGLLQAAGGRHEERQAFLALVRNGNVVLDIGGNRGEMTLLFSHVVGPTGEVHAFEPVPPTFQRLQQRLAAEQRFQNVLLNPIGLSDACGTAEIHLPSGDDGQASLKRHALASWERPGVETFTCQLQTLDAYVEQAGLTRIDFVKLDVEGAELLAVRGGVATLSRFLPTLHAEYFAGWAKDFGYDGTALIGQLREIGYRHFYDGFLRPLPDPEGALAAPSATVNLVATARPLV